MEIDSLLINYIIILIASKDTKSNLIYYLSEKSVLKFKNIKPTSKNLKIFITKRLFHKD